MKFGHRHSYLASLLFTAPIPTLYEMFATCEINMNCNELLYKTCMIFSYLPNFAPSTLQTASA